MSRNTTDAMMIIGVASMVWAFVLGYWLDATPYEKIAYRVLATGFLSCVAAVVFASV